MNLYNVLLIVRKPDGKRPLGRSRHRSIENFKMHLKEIGFEAVNRILLAESRDHGGLS
jgi:hypothetical protein